MKPRILLITFISLILIFNQRCTEKEDWHKEEHPNIIFIAIDDLNDWIGPLGGHTQVYTPNFDRLIDQSVTFTNAHSNCPACQPSRNSILSGLHPTSIGWYSNNWNRKDVERTYDSLLKKSVALPQYFRENGYKTMAAGKIYHNGVAEFKHLIPILWDEVDTAYHVEERIFSRGNGYGGSGGHHYHPFPEGGSPIIQKFGKIPGFSLTGGPLDEDDIPAMGMHDAYIANWAALKLKEDHDTPFFLALGFVRPHVPFTAPREFFDRYDNKNVRIPEVPDGDMADIPIIGKAMAYGLLPMGDHKTVLEMGPDYWRDLTHAYLASISFVDAQVGKVMDALAESKYSDNTIVLLWSDHGQHLGEKKHWRKMALWEESTRVPLIIHVPGMDKSLQIAHPVSLLDIYPTLVDLSNLPENPAVAGNKLTTLINNPESIWDYPVVSCWFSGNYAIRNDRWRYILYSDGTEELYDHRKDSNEWNNLADDPDYAEVINELRKSIPLSSAPPFQDPEWAGNTPEHLADQWRETEIPAWLE